MVKQLPLALATAERIQEIAAISMRGVRDFYQSDPLDDGTSSTQRREHLQVGAAGLRFCAAAAAQLGEPALLDLVIASIDVFPHFDRIDDACVCGIAAGLTGLLRRGAPTTPDVVRLAAHEDVRIRDGVAAGLRPTGEAEVALLRQLAADPSPDVRGAARESLEGHAVLPWWLGKWSRDPTAELTAAERGQHAEAMDRIAEILDGRQWEIARAWDELTGLAARLPDATLIDLAESLLRTADASGFRDASIPTLLLSRPGGGEALVRILRRWDGDSSSGFHGRRLMTAATLAIARPQRAPIVEGLVRLALAGTPEERGALFSTAVVAAEIAGQAWPPGEDTEPLLDALLALDPPAERFDSAKSHLAEALQHPPDDPAQMRARALDARRAGYPGGFAGLTTQLDALLAAVGGDTRDEGGG